MRLQLPNMDAVAACTHGASTVLLTVLLTGTFGSQGTRTRISDGRGVVGALLVEIIRIPPVNCNDTRALRQLSTSPYPPNRLGTKRNKAEQSGTKRNKAEQKRRAAGLFARRPADDMFQFDACT